VARAPHVASGAFCRDLQRLEVVLIQRGFGAIRDLETNVAKDVEDAPRRIGDGVQSARVEFAGRQRNVAALSLELTIKRELVDVGLAFRVCRLDLHLSRVRGLAGGWSLVGAQLPDRAHMLRQGPV